MNPIMSHREWMKLTDGGTTSVRSPALKMLDMALLSYEKKPDPVSRQTLVTALHNWINAQGSGWKTSVRNKRKGVETLFLQLGPEGGQVRPDRLVISNVQDRRQYDLGKSHGRLDHQGRRPE